MLAEYLYQLKMKKLNNFLKAFLFFCLLALIIWGIGSFLTLKLWIWDIVFIRILFVIITTASFLYSLK